MATMRRARTSRRRRRTRKRPACAVTDLTIRVLVSYAAVVLGMLRVVNGIIMNSPDGHQVCIGIGDATGGGARMREAADGDLGTQRPTFG